jgi:predicted metal-binding membrane protein
VRGASDRTFVWISALLFVASTAVTVAWCGSMSAMGGMPMPGGWSMSMAWMRMPGQTWLAAAATFLAMWTVMMVAMMLPSLVPMLRAYRDVAGAADGPGIRSLLAAAGYFCVWTAVGAAVYPFGVALAGIAMRVPAVSRALPAAGGAAVLLAGLVQLSRWKTRCLASCAARPAGRLEADARGAWGHGIRLGLHCGRCCANLMAVMLVLGVMDAGVMGVVALAVTAERVAPARGRVARAIGAVLVAAGAWLLARAVRLG